MNTKKLIKNLVRFLRKIKINFKYLKMNIINFFKKIPNLKKKHN